MLSARNRTQGFLALLTGAFLLFALTGCNSKSSATPENFITGLNAHFLDHPDCLFPTPPTFPYETGDAAMTKQMNALVDAQLLKGIEAPRIHVTRYTPTDAGARVAPRFCYGHRVVTAIDTFSPPAQANGFPETQVTYHYTIDNEPVWAKSDAMRAAFPDMALKTSGTASDHATLAGTMAGWQVPD
jgi:hypothetical protein